MPSSVLQPARAAALQQLLAGTTLMWGVLVFAALLPIGLLGLYAYQSAATSMRNLVRANNLSAATITAELVSRDLENSLSMAQAFASLPGMVDAIERHDEDAVRERLRVVVESNRRVDRAFVLDTAGVL